MKMKLKNDRDDKNGKRKYENLCYSLMQICIREWKNPIICPTQTRNTRKPT